MGVLALCVLATSAPAADTPDPCELVSFDYDETLNKTGDTFRIQWTAVMQSSSPSDGLCRIVLRLGREGEPVQEFPSELFSMDAMGKAEIGDLFHIPRELWKEATLVEVAAENMAPRKPKAAAVEAIPGTPDCVDNALAAQELFHILREQIEAKRDDLTEMETQMMVSGGLLTSTDRSYGQNSETAAKRNAKRMDRLESELERLTDKLQQEAEDHCRSTP
jgi:hypothetical protein